MIRFENVTKIYPGQERAALDSVSLEIIKGEFVFLVGLSGSGKSTFLRLILREERPTSGVIHVAGKDLGTLATHKVPELRRQVGTVFHAKSSEEMLTYLNQINQQGIRIHL